VSEPAGSTDETFGEQLDVEPEVARAHVYLLLFGREQVDK
jgi:hypothetical protein